MEFKVTIKKIEKQKESKLRGYADVLIDNKFVIHGIKIIQGKEKLFIAMPDKKVEDKFYDIVHPINNEVREALETAILNEFTKE